MACRRLTLAISIWHCCAGSLLVLLIASFDCFCTRNLPFGLLNDDHGLAQTQTQTQTQTQFSNNDQWPTIRHSNDDRNFNARAKRTRRRFRVEQLIEAKQIFSGEKENSSNAKSRRVETHSDAVKNKRSIMDQYTNQNDDFPLANHMDGRTSIKTSSVGVQVQELRWQQLQRRNRQQRKSKSKSKASQLTRLKDGSTNKRYRTAILEEPPAELVFSNQSGAVAYCGVAYELAESLARADKQQAELRAANADADGLEQDAKQRLQQQQIEIRWEKVDSGEEIEQVLYGSESISAMTSFADELAKQDNEPAAKHTKRRPVLRYVRARDGALVFEPFKAIDYRPEVHSTTYRCVAVAISSGQPSLTESSHQRLELASINNQAVAQTGPLATAGSRDMRVRAIVVQAGQSMLQIEVMDELVLEGNQAVFKCQLPSYAQAYLQLVDWVEFPGEKTISLALQQEQWRQQMLATNTSSAAFDQLSQYVIHPKSGDLIVLNTPANSAQGNNYKSYKCRCKNKLTGELVSSVNRAKLIVSESHSPMAPKVSIYSAAPSSVQQLGDSSQQQAATGMASGSLVYEQGELALLVCHLQAFPRASISWFKQRSSENGAQVAPADNLTPIETHRLLLSHSNRSGSSPSTESISNQLSKFVQLDNLLFIRRVQRNDSGQYVCVARNQLGEERFQTELLIRSKLEASLSVSANVLELGKSLALECSISGFPIQQVTFKHNQNVIKSISGSDSMLLTSTSNNHQMSPTVIRSSQAQQQHQHHALLRNYFVLDDDDDDDDAGEPEKIDDKNDELVADHQRLSDNSSLEQFPAATRLNHVMVIMLEPQHAGAYQCVAQNQFETSLSTSFVRVLNEPPKFKQTFKSQVYQANQEISLSCAAAANPIPEITWSIDDQPLSSIDSSNRIRFGDFVTKENLVISYVNISQAQLIDSGLYKCTADNRLARVVHEAQVSVMGEPFVKPMTNVTVLASTTFRQRCLVAGHPIGEIQWHHRNQRLPVNHRQHVYENGTLEVENMERFAGDEGEYTCVIVGPQQTRLGPASRTQADQQQQQQAGGRNQANFGSVHVSIRVKPSIEPFAISRQLREGQRASIMCTISSGDLPISISWFRNDRLLVAATGINRGDQEQQPSGEQQSSSLAVLQTLGENLLLNGLRISRVSDYSSTLLFESLLSEHSANYTCLARNDAGSASHQAPMIVQVAPKWSSEPTDTNVVRGSGSTIDCVASGFPPPRIIWTKASGEHQPESSKQLTTSNGSPPNAKDQQLQVGASQSKLANQLGAWRSIVSSPHLQVFENGSLNILDARDSDFGHYMCQASNGVGPGLSKVIRVTINVAAQFQTSRHAIQYVARGELAHLKCQAKGDWPLHLSWFKNRQPLELVDLHDLSQQQTAAEQQQQSSSVMVSNTVASIVLLPATSQDSSGKLSPFQNSSSNSIHLLQQPAGNFDPNDHLGLRKQSSFGNPNAAGSGLLMPRYSLQQTEFVLANRLSATLDSSLDQLGQELKQLQQRHSNPTLEDTNSRLSSGSLAQPNRLPVLVQVSNTLIIQQTDRQDTGTFKCLATNYFGTDERNIQLIVQEPPERIEEVSVLETNSRSITLGWLAPFDGNAPITNYHIQYRVVGSNQQHQLHLADGRQSESFNSLDWSNYTIASSATTTATAATTTSSTSVAPGISQDLPNSISVNSQQYNNNIEHQLSKSSSSSLTRSRILNKVTVNSLKPITHYWFRLSAENKLGQAVASVIVEALTIEEAPGAAPSRVKAVAQSSSSILVSWAKLNEREMFGSIQGYYVAYKPILTNPIQVEPRTDETRINKTAPGEHEHLGIVNRQQTPLVTNIFKTIAHDEKLQKFDAILTGLKRSTKYMISVQAFNGRGTGPSSEPIVLRTLDLDPPRQLKLFVKQATNCSLEIEWRPLSQAALMLSQSHLRTSSLQGSDINKNEINNNNNNELQRNGLNPVEADIVDYYSLYQAELNEQPRWQEVRIAGQASSHSIEQLKCGTRYQFYMIGVNKIGLGDQSEILDTKTNGGLPIAPDRQSTFDVINTTCYVVRLDHWQDNGCPIKQFSVRQRLEPSREWLQVAHFDMNPNLVVSSQTDSTTSTTTTMTTSNAVQAGQFREETRVTSTNPSKLKSKRSLDELQASYFDDASSSSRDQADDVDSSFIDYPIAAAAMATDDLSIVTGDDDYLALESESLISKTTSRRPVEFDMLKDSSSLVLETANDFEDSELATGKLSIGGRNRQTTTKAMPQLAQEWQASNFMLEQDLASAALKDIEQTGSMLTKQQQDWRRVRLCNLAENAYYTVQIRAENRVGETEAELRLLTSPEGLEYDQDIKRHVVGRLGGLNGDPGGSAHHRLIHSAATLNDKLSGLMSFNQWPILVPIMLTLTMMTIIIIIALLLKKTSPHNGMGNNSPGSSTTSKATSTTLNMSRNNNNAGAGPVSSSPSNYHDNRESPTSSQPAQSFHNHHHGKLYLDDHNLYQHGHIKPSTNGAPSVLSTTDGLIGSSAGDLMLGPTLSATNEHYATGTMPAQHRAYHPQQHYSSSLCRATLFDKELELNLQQQPVNEMTLSNIYQQQINQQHQRSINYQEEPAYSQSNCANGSLITNLTSNGSSAMTSSTDQRTNLSTNSPTINSTSTNNGTGTHLGHQTLPLHLHHPHQQVARGLNVYLCTKDEQQMKQQEAAIFYGLDPQQMQYGQQVHMRRFQQQDDSQAQDDSQQQQQHPNIDECNNHNQILSQNNTNSTDHRTALAFDPVYATIRRTFPQAFKYLTLQHNQQQQQSQQTLQPVIGNQQTQEMAFFESVSTQHE